MKKLILFVLAAAMLLTLAACGGNAEQPGETTTQSTTQDAVETTRNEDLKALAQSCVGKTVEELYDLVGQPDDSAYADSCLNPGVGEDGNLYYEGFTVYTYKEGDVETVEYVE